MPNLIPHCAARVDSLASATLLVAAALRLWNAARFQVGSPEFTAVSLVFAAAAAVPPALLLRAASAQLYMRRRAAVVVAVRLAMAACIWSTHPLPEPPLRSCAAFSWNWPTNSHAITLLFVALGYPLPLGTHVWVTAVSLVPATWMAESRCAAAANLEAAAGAHGGGAAGAPFAPAPQPARLQGASFLEHYPPTCFAKVVHALDWPFRVLFPDGSWAQDTAPSHATACLLSTLWLQIAVGGLLPTMLLWLRGHWARTNDATQSGGSPGSAQRAGGRSAGRQGGAARGSARSARAGSGDGLWVRAGRRLDAWLADWLGELPVASHLFAAQMLYLMLRAAQLLFLP